MPNRLRGRLGELVSWNQSAFVKSRSLNDNFVLVRQVARKINLRRHSGVLLKLDLSRALDTMSWVFLFEVLRRMGFGDRFLKWTAVLLYTANTKKLVKGVPVDRIQYARSLRQGDPTSPLLFVAGMEVLTAMIKKACDSGFYSNLCGNHTVSEDFESMHDDDVVLFLKPCRTEMEVTRQILNVFRGASGLRVNYRKNHGNSDQRRGW
jgi:hypothetical protein